MSWLNLFDFLFGAHSALGRQKVHGLDPHWSGNSAVDFWPTLKYLVLITATTFTLAAYCRNIIPKGLQGKGITPLFNHRRDGSYSHTQAFLFYLRNGTQPQQIIQYRLPLTKSSRKLWDERHSITLNYTEAKFDWAVHLISQVGLVDFELLIWLLALFTCLPRQCTAPLMNVCTVSFTHLKMILLILPQLSTVR